MTSVISSLASSGCPLYQYFAQAASVVKPCRSLDNTCHLPSSDVARLHLSPTALSSSISSLYTPTSQHINAQYCQNTPPSIAPTVTSSGIEEICSHGNVILCAGEGEEERRWRVSSVVLSVSSKVFAAMFEKNRFVESYALSKYYPKDIHLGDDELEPLGILLKLLHHQGHAESLCSSQDVTFILHLARLTEKYDCVQALTHTSHLIIEEAMNRKDNDWAARGKLAQTTYLLNQARQFQQITQSIVLKDCEDFFKHCEPNVEIVPAYAWRKSLVSPIFSESI